MDTKVWEAFTKSKVFIKWYIKFLKKNLSNVYDIKTKNAVDIRKQLDKIKPSTQTLVNFILDLDGRIDINIYSVEKNPVTVCCIEYMDIYVKRIARNLYDAVSVAACEFAHKYEMKMGAS